MIYEKVLRQSRKEDAKPPVFFVALRLFASLREKTHLSVTALEAEPPRLLRTVMFSGYAGHESEALKRPLPLFFNVPTRAPVDVT